MLQRIVLSLMILVAGFAPFNPAPVRAADCQFVLGFLGLQRLIPDQVGSCVTNATYSASGDATQVTTGATGAGGLMVWRKSDNFTAFSDGFRTWINGPFGLQVRLNSERFSWEPNPEGLPVVSVTAGVAVSSNWSGYAASGGGYTAVTGTWTVPESGAVGVTSASASWVGIGGLTTRDLIQAGTEVVNHSFGLVDYGAWIELLPDPPVTVPLPVGPGDLVTVAIAQRNPRVWDISMRNNTTGGSFETTVTYASSLSSAAWIHEAPTSRRIGILPLDDFEAVQFSAASVVKNGQLLSPAQADARPLAMIDRSGDVIALPTNLTPDGTAFTIVRTGL